MTEPEFDNSQWSAYFEFLTLLKEKHNFLMTSRSAEETKTRFMMRKKMNPLFYFHAVYDRERIIAFFDILLSQDNRSQTVGSIMVDTTCETPLPELSELLRKRIVTILKEHDCPKVYCMAANKRSSRLMASLGVHPESKIERFILNRSYANTEIIESWLNRFPELYPDLKLSLVTTIPDKYIDDYVDLYNQFIREMPSEKKLEESFRVTEKMIRDGETSNKAVGTVLYTLLLLDSDDSLIGYSNVSINKKSPANVYQAMTGIKSNWRGQGLSRWLKGSLFIRIGEDFPDNELFFTDMRAVNKPIQAVNAEMGYRLVSLGNDFSIKLSDLISPDET
jgi:hypothetical protein